MDIDAEYFIFDDPGADGLKITAKRYTSRSRANKKGLTLLFAHCIGSHKEQWEPVIQRLFQVQETEAEVHRIREAWSFDWQSHGDAAVLNHNLLKDRTKCVSVYEWTPALAAFIRSPRMQGHRIVPLGHSAGAAAMLLTTKEIPPSTFAAMILIEPTIVTREVFNSELEDRMSAMDFSVAATSSRRDVWPSRDEAFHYFKKRIPWRVWDERVILLLTRYGLRELPGGGGVTLKCERKMEAVSYPDTEPHFEAAIQLCNVCHAIPIHLIWGTRNDLVPEFIQDSLADVTEGRIVASVTKIKQAGHMVVQEQPDALAKAISDILVRIGPGCQIIADRSKL